MAAPKRFHIPSADEMEHAEKEALSERLEPLFKRSKVEQSSGTTSEHLNTVKTMVEVSGSSNDNDAEPNTNTVTSHKSDGQSAKPSDPKDTNIGVQELPTNRSIVSSNSLIVNTQQRGNPILKFVRNIPWEYGNIMPDYVMGVSNCALFLSLRYHQLHPNYIHGRLKQLGKSYELRVMLVQVDVKEPHFLLKDVAKICILADCTLILAFSAEEAGRYLETYKVFENKPPEAIMERTEENFMAQFTDCLTRVKSVNKTDCATVLTHFGSLSNVMEASKEDLSLCPGFGPQKAKRLYDMFHEPFKRTDLRRQQQQTNIPQDEVR